MREGQTQSCDFCSQIGVDCTNLTVWCCLLVSILYLWWSHSTELLQMKWQIVFPKAAAASLALLLCDLALSSSRPHHSPLLESGQTCDCFTQEGWNSLEELLRKRTRLKNKKMTCYVAAESLVTLFLFVFCNAIVFAMTWKMKINLMNG